MSPSITCLENNEKRSREYRLSIPHEVFLRARLDEFDILLLNECEKSEKVEDKLLALELIVRKGAE